MRTPLFARLLLALIVTVGPIGCSKRETPVQSAVHELRRLAASTQSQLDSTEYSHQLSAAKAAIAAALKRSDDDAAESRIETALNYYLQAESAWQQSGSQAQSKVREVQDYWTKAREATESAAQFAVADAQQREQIREQEMEAFNAALRASEQARKQADEAQRAREVARTQAEEQKIVAEAAQRERARRFAPEGIVYSTKRISLTTADGVISIPAGAELEVASRSADGTVRVRRGDLEVEVAASAVTTDRDLVASLRTATRR